MAKNLYETLGVKETASELEIRKGFRKQSLKFHPDKNPEGEEQFKKINTAYNILNDSNKRARYDRGDIDDNGAPVESATQSKTSQNQEDAAYDQAKKNYDQAKKAAADRRGSEETTNIEQVSTGHDVREQPAPTPPQDEEPKKDNQETEADNKEDPDDRATILIAMMQSTADMAQGVYSAMWKFITSEPKPSDKLKDEDKKSSKDEDTKISKAEDPKTEDASKENPKADLSKLSTDSVIPAIQLEATNAANYDKDVSKANKTAQPTPPEEAPDIEMNKTKV